VEVEFSTHNIVDLKLFANIFKIETLHEAATSDEVFEKIQQKADSGIQHIFVWFTQGNYNKVVITNTMTVIPGDNMLPVVTLDWHHNGG
jgi:hypothetical protein